MTINIGRIGTNIPHLSLRRACAKILELSLGDVVSSGLLRLVNKRYETPRTVSIERPCAIAVSFRASVSDLKPFPFRRSSLNTKEIACRDSPRQTEAEYASSLLAATLFAERDQGRSRHPEGPRGAGR